MAMSLVERNQHHIALAAKDSEPGRPRVRPLTRGPRPVYWDGVSAGAFSKALKQGPRTIRLPIDFESPWGNPALGCEAGSPQGARAVDWDSIYA
jgi:hypothetical protein